MAELKGTELNNLVDDLWSWLESTAEGWADGGDTTASDFEELAKIIKGIPSDVDLPESFWIY